MAVLVCWPTVAGIIDRPWDASQVRKVINCCCSSRWSIKGEQAAINYNYGRFYWNSYRVLLFIRLLSPGSLTRTYIKAEALVGVMVGCYLSARLSKVKSDSNMAKWPLRQSFHHRKSSTEQRCEWNGKCLPGPGLLSDCLYSGLMVTQLSEAQPWCPVRLWSLGTQVTESLFLRYLETFLIYYKVRMPMPCNLKDSSYKAIGLHILCTWDPRGYLN